MNRERYDRVCDLVIGAAIQVHRELGPGLLESVYEACMVKELRSQSLLVEPQVSLPIIYKGEILDKKFVIDILVEDAIVLELKSVEDILKVHEIQLLTYLKLSGHKLGLLINFNVPVLKQGIRRRINGEL